VQSDLDSWEARRLFHHPRDQREAPAESNGSPGDYRGLRSVGRELTLAAADSSILVTCPGCGRSYRMPSRAAGRKGTCKKCGARFSIADAATAADVPAPAAPAGLSPRALRTRDLLRLLNDSLVFPKQRVTIAHRLAALAVAGVMLVLPILYLAFVAAIAGLTWWHARYDWIWMKATFGYVTIVAAAVYAGLSIGGALWTLSLIQPLFSSIGARDEGPGLSRLDEPALFAFVDRLADKVGCPRPDIIRLSLDVNASAYYETSLFGLRRRTFTLTLGLPLVGGLTLTQLAGVIAHELRHFGQRGSGFLDRFIKRVNLWFALAVGRPSLLDELIASLGDGGYWLMSLVAILLWFLVVVGRYTLWCLTQIGLIASASLMRRMEFDADCYEVGVIGSAEFEGFCQRLLELTVAHDLAIDYAFGSRDCRLLPSDLVAFIAELADREPKIKKRARKLIALEGHNWLASHPTVRDRIAHAQRLNLPAVFQASAPGSELFESFESQSRATTAWLYRHWLGPGLTPDAIRPAEEVVEIYLAGGAAREGFQLPAGAR
jgi:Zn-dependent protease with chaperone function